MTPTTYAKLPERPGSRHYMITWDQGWRCGILAAGLYEHHADWLLALIDGQPLPEPPP